MKKYDRVFILVIDSLGIGQDDTSKKYGDVGVDTLLHISESVDSFKIPNLQQFICQTTIIHLLGIFIEKLCKAIHILLNNNTYPTLF